MGVVYLAREVHLDRLVAIKLLPPDRAADPALRERFLREVRLAAKLSHPNIIPIHAVEESADFVFYVMAFIDGETLTQRVRQRGPLAGSDGARVLREVAWALGYAHEQGFVHRDVKPDNILIERSSGRVLVADFGIAAALGNVSADGITGTPEFMSPEQVLGKSLDGRTDIYGLGATAFFAFSGRFPFEGASPTEILAKQVATPAPALGSLGVAVPRKIASLIDRCLRKEPDDRPATANQVAEQITALLEQRREIPVALRSFIKRGARMNSGGTLLGTIAVLPTSVGAAYWLGAPAGYAALAGVSIGAPFIYMTAASLRLVRQGFAHADLEPAFKAEMDQTEEELAIERRPARPILERVSTIISKLSAAAAVMSLGAIFNADRFNEWYVFLFALTSATAVFSGMVYGLYAQQRQDLETRFWAKLWKGAMGRGAFALAARFAGPESRTTAMTHRATELSLGLAAEQLYESLPKETKKQLAAVPELLIRLQSDAQMLRRQRDDLQDVVGGDGTVDSELIRLRDTVHVKLGEAVGALETIRLDLLRLHAGAANMQSITTHLGDAAEVSNEIGRLIAAHSEVGRSFEFPRLAASTPV
jgi:serine/threonine-protein kinase